MVIVVLGHSMEAVAVRILKRTTDEAFPDSMTRPAGVIGQSDGVEQEGMYRNRLESRFGCTKDAF